MRIYEAMVKIPKDKCPMCAPGTTFKGTHANIVHMTTAAKNKYDAWKHFLEYGSVFSKIHKIGSSKI